ncbi:dNTP triphosphohydrolase [Mariniblastus sp.]|nr:dNTP triphosphohydrolase [Mariniblastus sp.]
MPPKLLFDPSYSSRLSKSDYDRDNSCAQFLSDHSRIIFSSSFRRLVKKAQVFSLESNTAVRNRLTHSLEVADVGRTIARSVGLELVKIGRIDADDVPCLTSIVENACLMHDIGNPPFGHFGESAIQRWFKELDKNKDKVKVDLTDDDLNDQINFDGNPQGFRIATRLHCERDGFSLNLTCATLLASIKYPHSQKPDKGHFAKKIGFFQSENDVYESICSTTGHTPGRRYFLAYLMELADDCCYCLSDIADSFEKQIISLEQYTTAVSTLCQEANLDPTSLACLTCAGDFDFRFQVAIPLTKLIIEQSTVFFVET